MTLTLICLRLRIAFWVLAWHESMASHHQDRYRRTVALLVDLGAQRTRLLRRQRGPGRPLKDWIAFLVFLAGVAGIGFAGTLWMIG